LRAIVCPHWSQRKLADAADVPLWFVVAIEDEELVGLLGAL
jgi:hypothetical protein